MEKQLQDIGDLLLQVIREILVFGATGLVIGLLLRKVVKEWSERLINTIECLTEETRKHIEKLVESMEGFAAYTGTTIERRLASSTAFTEQTGSRVSDDVATGCTRASGESSMSIFVGNLALTITEQDLRQLFEPYGTVDMIKIITDRNTGHARGFGFVEMPDRRAAHTAIAALNGTPLAGRTLTVAAARPRTPRREPRPPHW